MNESLDLEAVELEQPSEAAETILAAAGRLFARKGYHATTTREIAAAVGLKQPSLFHWFPSKEAILRTLAARALRFPLRVLRQVETEGASASTKLYKIVYLHTLYLCTQPLDLTAVLDSTAVAPDVVTDWTPLVDRYTQGVRKIIEDGIEGGEFVLANPNAVTMAILGMCNSTIRWYRPGGALSPESVAQEYAQHALRSLVVDRRIVRTLTGDPDELGALLEGGVSAEVSR